MLMLQGKQTFLKCFFDSSINAILHEGHPVCLFDEILVLCNLRYEKYKIKKNIFKIKMVAWEIFVYICGHYTLKDKVKRII